MTAASILPLELQGVSFERDRQRLLKEVSVRIAEGAEDDRPGPQRRRARVCCSASATG